MLAKPPDCFAEAHVVVTYTAAPASCYSTPLMVSTAGAVCSAPYKRYNRLAAMKLGTRALDAPAAVHYAMLTLTLSG